MRAEIRQSVLGGWVIRIFDDTGSFHFVRCQNYEGALGVLDFFSRVLG